MAKDNTLINRAQSGDEGAFADLMRTYHPFVYAIVIGIVNNPHDAEEIVQNAFVNAHRGLPQLEQRTKFKSWLAEISRNCARDWLRKQLNDTVPIDEVSEHTRQTPALDEQLIRDEQSELVRRATETLPQKDKEITQAYYFDGASYDELTRTHGLSYKAISVRLSRARQKLAKRLGHLLTGVFVSPITTLKQIYSGGLTVMKVGTVPKITAGAVAIIVLAFIGTRQFISSKADPSPSVEIITSTPNETENSVAQTDGARKGAVTAPLPEDKPQISAEEMAQIEDFFAKLEGADAQSEMDTRQSPTNTEVDQNTDERITTDTDAFAEDIEQTAEEVRNAFVEAFRNLDFEVMLSLMTGVAKEGLENTWLDAQKNGLLQIEVTKEVVIDGEVHATEEMTEKVTRQMEEQMLGPILEVINQAEVVSSEHVGDEFHFRLGMQAPEIPVVESPDTITGPSDIQIKMRKVDGEWRVYEMEFK